MAAAATVESAVAAVATQDCFTTIAQLLHSVAFFGCYAMLVEFRGFAFSYEVDLSL